MLRLELSGRDAETLAEVLESVLSDLRFEIAATDSKDYRERLKTRKATLMAIVGSLKLAA